MKIAIAFLVMVTLLMMAVGAFAATPPGKFTTGKITTKKHALNSKTVKTPLDFKISKQEAEPVFKGSKQGGEDISTAVAIPDIVVKLL